MPEGGTSVHVSKEVRDRLTALKAALRKRTYGRPSLGDVIKMLLDEHDRRGGD